MNKSSATRMQTFLGRHELLKKVWKHRVFYLFLLPGFAATIIFYYRPFRLLEMAFRNYTIYTIHDGVSGAEWVGWKNFIDFFTGHYFWKILRNTLAINGFALLFGFPMPIIFALMLNELRQRKFKKWVQTITYLPHFVSWVIVAGLFYFLLDETTGVVNDLIETTGGARVPFFRRSDLFWPLIILAAIWKEIGWSSIIYLAALSSIDTNLYEAVRIDGANKWQEVWNITLPGLLPTISVLLIITTGRILIGGGLIPSFQAVWNMANPMLSETSETIGIHTYLVGVRQGKYAYGTAAGLFQSFVAFVFVFGSNFLAKKFKGYGVV